MSFDMRDLLRLPIVTSEAVPTDDIWLIPPRREAESMEAWFKRCAKLSDIPPDGKHGDKASPTEE